MLIACPIYDWIHMALFPKKKKNTKPKKREESYNSEIKTAKGISLCLSQYSQPLPNSFPCHLNVPARVTRPAGLPSTTHTLAASLSGFPFTRAFIWIFLPYTAADFVSMWYLQNCCLQPCLPKIGRGVWVLKFVWKEVKARDRHYGCTGHIAFGNQANVYSNFCVYKSFCL